MTVILFATPLLYRRDQITLNDSENIGPEEDRTLMLHDITANREEWEAFNPLEETRSVGEMEEMDNMMDDDDFNTTRGGSDFIIPPSGPCQHLSCDSAGLGRHDSRSAFEISIFDSP